MFDESMTDLMQYMYFWGSNLKITRKRMATVKTAEFDKIFRGKLWDLLIRTQRLLNHAMCRNILC
jgi:hypothetical protein